MSVPNKQINQASMQATMKSVSLLLSGTELVVSQAMTNVRIYAPKLLQSACDSITSHADFAIVYAAVKLCLLVIDPWNRHMVLPQYADSNMQMTVGSFMSELITDSTLDSSADLEWCCARHSVLMLFSVHMREGLDQV